MSVNWPPLDLHSHVDPDIAASELLHLRAVVFAATRTLDEAESALARQHSDLLAVWGVGTHPAMKNALDGFDSARFATLVERSAYVSEIGLDGQVRARLPRQIEVLTEVLSTLQRLPRIASLHSYGATSQLLDLLELTPVRGAVLHWWIGDAVQTQRAVELGAYFSVNSSNLKHKDVLSAIPVNRLLSETDHPNGNRWSPQPRQPGNVTKVEKSLGELHGMSAQAFRRQSWANLKRLTEEIDCGDLLPQRVQAILAEA